MIGRALKLLRTYHDLTQAELASQLGISNSHISEVESDKKKPTIEMLEKYSRNFDLPLSSILFFSEKLNDNEVVDKVRFGLAKKIVSILEWNENRHAIKEKQKENKKLSA